MDPERDGGGGSQQGAAGCEEQEGDFTHTYFFITRPRRELVAGGARSLAAKPVMNAEVRGDAPLTSARDSKWLTNLVRPFQDIFPDLVRRRIVADRSSVIEEKAVSAP